MSHEIEADFIKESKNDEKQCQYCASCSIENKKVFCKELNMEVPLIGYCDFFQSKD